jgi:hypothetical protein
MSGTSNTYKKKGFQPGFDAGSHEVHTGGYNIFLEVIEL